MENSEKQIMWSRIFLNYCLEKSGNLNFEIKFDLNPPSLGLNLELIIYVKLY